MNTHNPDNPKPNRKFILENPVHGSIGEQKFKTKITWRNGTLITDEPETIGGQDLGPDPHTLLLSSLIACTLATLRMYIDHKKMNIPEINIQANLAQRIHADGSLTTTIVRDIDFGHTALEDETVEKLKEIAEKCPISRILKGNILIENEPIV